MAIPVSEVISHWSHFFKNFSLSSDLFYSQLEKVVRGHDMPNATISRTKHKEGGMLSASREYLRIKHEEFVFDVCAAPFGNNFFISWWLYETEGTVQNLLKNTKVGTLLKARNAKKTFFQVDGEEMFRSCVHECILEAISNVTEGKGFRELSDSEKAYK